MGKHPWETPRSTLLAKRRASPASLCIYHLSLCFNCIRVPAPCACRRLVLPFIVAGALVLQTSQLGQPRVRKVDRCGGRRPRLHARTAGVALPSRSAILLATPARVVVNPTARRRCRPRLELARPRFAEIEFFSLPPDPLQGGPEGLAGPGLASVPSGARGERPERDRSRSFARLACGLASPFRPSTSVTQEN